MDESSDGEARLKPRETRGRKGPPDDPHGLKPVSRRASGINHSNVATPADVAGVWLYFGGKKRRERFFNAKAQNTGAGLEALRLGG